MIYVSQSSVSFYCRYHLPVKIQSSWQSFWTVVFYRADNPLLLPWGQSLPLNNIFPVGSNKRKYALALLLTRSLIFVNYIFLGIQIAIFICRIISSSFKFWRRNRLYLKITPRLFNMKTAPHFSNYILLFSSRLSSKVILESLLPCIFRICVFTDSSFSDSLQTSWHHVPKL